MKHLITIRLDQIIKYLNPLLPLANCHMVDFFTSSIFQNYIPGEIQNEINSNGQKNVLESILNDNLDISKYSELVKFLTEAKNNNLANFSEICLNLDNLQLNLMKLGCENSPGSRMYVFMSSKKSHEVEIMSQISTAVCEIARNNIVVDIGDGKGYLSSTLALHNGLKVLGIDSSDINTKGAAKRITKLKRVWKGSNNDKVQLKENELYKQVTKFVTEETDLEKIAQDLFPGSNNLSLVGLHTCGNLASTCIKIFVNNPYVTTICNVGCCYHLLEEEFCENGQNPGFPLSDYLKRKQYKLGRNARMLASQSLDRIISNRELPSKILLFRALLQIILIKNHPNLLTEHVGRCSKKDPTFLEYVRKSFTKFGTSLSVSDDEILALYRNYLPEEMNLQIFYLIRAHLAPVIESIIILDRLLFLTEQNMSQVFLVKMFDPVISPRCYGLVALK